jgi:hypothetical protein
MRLGKLKQALLLVGFIFVSVSAESQQSPGHRYSFSNGNESVAVTSGDHSIVINYSVPELNLSSINTSGGRFFRAAIPGHVSTLEPGKPELPVFSRLIEIPEGYSYRVKITDVKSSELRPSAKKIRGVLYPAQEPQTKDSLRRRQFSIDKKIYAGRSYIKSDTVTIENIGIVRHRKLATLFISPLRYNPHTNKLSVITSMKIEVLFVPEGSSSSISAVPDSRLFTETLAKGVLNYNPENVVPGYRESPVRMIILTDTAFRKQIEPFVKWKTQKGFRVQVLYRGSAYSGESYADIKNTLTDIYNSSTTVNPPPEYLLIIGDVAHIPYNSSGNYTDMYYGEFDGNGDYIPDMYIGRLPARDSTDVKAMLGKIVQYEKFDFSPSNTFYKNSLASAGVDFDFQYYMNGQVYYDVTNYLNTSSHINGYSFSYPASVLAKDSIVKIINKGVSFINYTGHGVTNGWLHMNISTADTALMKNANMYPFIISNACATSAFFNNGSFGNVLVRARNKGAIGYIGCSDNSYWDEDYFWAIGVGPLATEPTYATTGLGALDRLFHTHGEKPSEWYASMGQVNYAGNLAVSSSTSSKKKYYWETYNLVGDPSVIPVIGQADTFNIAIPDTIPNKLTNLSFISEPFSYVAVSHFDTLYDATYASESGSVNLKIPSLTNDSCLIVITGQNRKPLIRKIYIADNHKEYINLKSSGVSDYSGNNNGLADYGENIMLTMTVRNSGTLQADNLRALLSTSSPWITLTTDSVNIGTLPAGNEITLNNSFPVSVSGNVPDLTVATINLTLKDSKTAKKFRIDICAHSPKLDITGFRLDDSMTGNGNYVPDPGETLNLIFKIDNMGTSVASGLFSVSSSVPDINLPEPSKNSGEIAYGTSSEIKVPIKLADDLSIGTSIPLFTQLNCGSININKSFSFKVGRIQESFESSTFRAFPWINRSTIPWTISSIKPYEGIFAARSGSITHNQNSVLSMKAIYSAPDTLKFRYTVSSESGYDYLYFKLNDVTVLKVSGEVPWAEASIPVAGGFNKMDWIYAKDGSVSAGSDMAMVDNIDFAKSSSVKYISRDILAARITSPVKKENLKSENVTVRLINIASDTVKGFNFAYRVNDLLPVSQHFDQQLIPFDTATISFKTQANLSLYGIYKITAYSFNNNDDYLANDTVKINIENTDIDEPLTVCPNPFREELQVIINSDSTTTAHFALVSPLGVAVADFDREISEGRNTISIKDLNIGPSVYYLRITFKGRLRTYPVVKIK